MAAVTHDTHGHVDAHGHHDHGHHEESFVSKYIFSQDHKMIGKQFLLTAVFMGMLQCFYPSYSVFSWLGQEKVLTF